MNADRAARIVRWWTRVYTAWLPADVRASRRAEVESDLWETLADDDASREILTRLFFGIADDLTWSVEQMDTTARTSAWWSLGSLVTIALFWVWLSTSPDSVLIRESVWAFPAALTIHLLGIVSFVGTRALVDLRLAGRAFTDVPVTGVVARMTPWMGIAAAIVAISGMALYMAEPARFLANLAFRIKLAALLIAVVNVWLLNAVTLRRVSDWNTARTPPRAARIHGYLSLALWVVILVMGQLMPFDIFRGL